MNGGLSGNVVIAKVNGDWVSNTWRGWKTTRSCLQPLFRDMVSEWMRIGTRSIL